MGTASPAAQVHHLLITDKRSGAPRHVGRSMPSYLHAPVAQGIEQLPSKQRAAGSNPVWGTIRQIRAVTTSDNGTFAIAHEKEIYLLRR